MTTHPTPRDLGRAAAQGLLRTDSLSTYSINLIADAVMDAYAPGHREEVLAELERRAADAHVRAAQLEELLGAAEQAGNIAEALRVEFVADNERLRGRVAAITALAFDATQRPDVRLSRIRSLIDPAARDLS